MKQITKVIALILVLTGCNNLNDQSMYKVDFEHLVRSAFYTQQALLGLHLSPTTETDSSRYVLLINSYCDLIDRGFIRASSKPKQCVTDAINGDQVPIIPFIQSDGQLVWTGSYLQQ